MLTTDEVSGCTDCSVSRAHFSTHSILINWTAAICRRRTIVQPGMNFQNLSSIMNIINKPNFSAELLNQKTAKNSNSTSLVY